MTDEAGDCLECVANATYEGLPMKTATFPSLRVDPELRDAAEGVLQEGESLSSFIEAAVRETIARRRTRADFISRGRLAREETQRTGVRIDARVVHDKLAGTLAAARK